MALLGSFLRVTEAIGFKNNKFNCSKHPYLKALLTHKMIRYALNMEIKPLLPGIDYRDALVFMGSCFSEHMSGRLTTLGFDVAPQTNGVVFNPISLAEAFQRILWKGDYTEADLIFHNGLWHGRFHHGRFSEINSYDALHKMNHALHALKSHLERCKTIFITFGSSYVYEYKESAEVFANCHKIPQSQFNKRLLSTDEIVNTWVELIAGIQARYAQVQFVFSVSPVKHLRDGVMENNLSKSTLLLSIHALQMQFPSLMYFPAFELINDDLRDYRFYENDGAHPNAMAVEHVFEQFKASYFDSKTQEYIQDIEKYHAMSKHRIQNADAEEGIKFMKKLEDFRKELETKYQIVL